MALTTRRGVMTKIANGKGITMPRRVAFHTVATTAAAAASGFFSTQLAFSEVGTTQPGTLVSMVIPTSSSPIRFVMASSATDGAVRSSWLCRIYVFGTASTTTVTSSAFTHDAATFPVTRTSLNDSSNPVNLIPMCYVTAAPTVTAPVFSFSYTNQDGGSVTGAKTMTLPSATTAVASGYILRLEDGDCAVRDITAVNVTTASVATGSLSFFGLELISPISNITTNFMSLHDGLLGGFGLHDLNPAVATSGTVTSYLGVVSLLTVTTSNEYNINIHGVLDS
jgi:hypothetical protein